MSSSKSSYFGIGHTQLWVWVCVRTEVLLMAAMVTVSDSAMGCVCVEMMRWALACMLHLTTDP